MGRVARDLTGQVFKNWRVLARDSSKKSSNAYWLCEDVNTGEQKSLPACQLKASVGYKATKPSKVPKIGTKINSWEVIKYIDTPHKGITGIQIRCHCGKERTVSLYKIPQLGVECRSCHIKRLHGTMK